MCIGGNDGRSSRGGAPLSALFQTLEHMVMIGDFGVEEQLRSERCLAPNAAQGAFAVSEVPCRGTVMILQHDLQSEKR
jgi:hypothetical protein